MYRSSRAHDQSHAKVFKNDRFSQMSKQQQIIEEKKRQILERNEEKKKREAEAAKKLEEEAAGEEKPKATNMFSNDGSFLEQFRKMSEDGQAPGMVPAPEGLAPVSVSPPAVAPLQPPPTPPFLSLGPMSFPPPPPPPVMQDIKPPGLPSPLLAQDHAQVRCDDFGKGPGHSQPPAPWLKVKEEKEDPDKYQPGSEDDLPSSQFNESYPIKRERKRKSRWGDAQDSKSFATTSRVPNKMLMEAASKTPSIKVPGMSGNLISKVTKTDPGLLQYARNAYGTTDLSEEDWKKAEDNYKVHLLYQDMMKKRAELEALQAKGKHKYEYDSDEETEGGTWEHKLRIKEMEATQEWAAGLTEMAKGKHHIGDFLPPEELKKFMDKYTTLKGGGEPDLSDYKEYKLTEENKGFQMLQKLGWSEGQGLGADGSGIVDPVNKARTRDSNQGLGLTRPDDVSEADDEYDAYRKRMMLAYRFRPNPLNNPRRPYY